MAYIIKKQPKPFTCTKCNTLFTAMAHVNQATTLEPCPYCQTNNGNMRCDKSAIEIARETLDTFIHSYKKHTITDRWHILQNSYKAFYEDDKTWVAQGDDPDNYFYPNNGSHPTYGIATTFIFNLSSAEDIQYTLDPREDEPDIIQVLFTYEDQVLCITHSPFAQQLWDDYFDEEYREMQKVAKIEQFTTPTKIRTFSTIFTKNTPRFNEIVNGTVTVDENDTILEVRGFDGYNFDSTGYKIDIIK